MDAIRRTAPDLGSLSRLAAEFIAERAAEALRRSGRFSLVLAGGGTPRGLYQALAAPPFRDRLDWGRCHLFWGDERCVAPDDPESNYGMAHGALISRVPLPAENIHRMKGELPEPEAAARDYETELRAWFGAPVGRSGPFPRFDLVLLGIGGDGHVASLFPDNPLLDERSRWVGATEAPSTYPTRNRISLTLPVLNAAACVAILAAGSGKRGVLGDVFRAAPPGVCSLPASLVRPQDGALVWFLDRAADPS